MTRCGWFSQFRLDAGDILDKTTSHWSSTAASQQDFYTLLTPT